MVRSNVFVTCQRCQRHKRHCARQLCMACYQRTIGRAQHAPPSKWKDAYVSNSAYISSGSLRPPAALPSAHGYELSTCYDHDEMLMHREARVLMYQRHTGEDGLGHLRYGEMPTDEDYEQARANLAANEVAA